MKLLIDGDILRYRYGFAAQKTDKTDPEKPVLIVEPEWKVVDALKWGIIRMLNLTGCREYQIYLSGPNNFRLKVDPEYKANRKDMEKPYHYKNITDYLIEVHEAIVTDGIEADDALAMALTADPEGSILASIDKDLNQVPGWHFDIVKENKYYVDEVEAARSFFSQMLQGDRTDNITGIRGIGPVKAGKIVDQFQSADELSDHIYRMYRDEFGETDGPIKFDKNWNLLWLLRSNGEYEEMVRNVNKGTVRVGSESTQGSVGELPSESTL